MPAQAKRASDIEALNKYAQARLQESYGDPAAAAKIYAENLKAQPDNALMASKAYVKAIEAGDYELALRAIRILELRGNLDAEMPLLLFADAFARKDWRGAENAALEMEALKNFGFLSPHLNAWIAAAKGNSPIDDLKIAEKSATAKFYHQEQVILHGLYLNNDSQVAGLIDRIISQNDARMSGLRIAAAQHYIARKNTPRALEILSKQRTGPEVKLYRDIKDGRLKPRGIKVTPASGAGFLLQRVASDLGLQQADFLALVTAQAASHVDPASDAVKYALGKAYQEADNPKQAVQTLAHIDKASPYGLVAVASEVTILSDDGNHDAALDRMAGVIAENPQSPEVHLMLGQLYQLKGEYPKAVTAFAEAVNLTANRDFSQSVLANYWLSLGSAQDQAGLWPEALASLKKADKLSPDNPTILNYIGYAQLERGENISEAIAAIRKAHTMRSSSAAITDSLGWAYYITGDYEKAVTYLEEALAGEPQDPTINEHLGDAYWAVGRKYEARYAWKSAKLFTDEKNESRLSDKIDVGPNAAGANSSASIP